MPLGDRANLVPLTNVLEVGQAPVAFEHPDLKAVADAIVSARRRGASVALLMGAHVIKQGLGRYVGDLARRGLVSVVAMNGACSVHDYELARIGGTSESVAKYIADGQFGLWNETGEINDIVAKGAREGLGYGEALGRHIVQNNLPHKDASVFGACWEAGVPATVHVGVGYDIIHQHPNFDGCAIGEASYRDFLIFTKLIENLEGGVVLCYGSAVMGPEVYLKALAMARNVAHQQGREIRHFTSAVFDLLPLSGDLHAEAPKHSAEYYYRPYKTVLVRTVADGGQSYYIRGDHLGTMPALHRMIMERQDRG